ncbi:MAG: transposase family protein [Treponema sp.]|nr:transposase family protein [Treponema sp.]
MEKPGEFSPQDPRIERNKLYPLEAVIVITILATIAMAPGMNRLLFQSKLASEQG